MYIFYWYIHYFHIINEHIIYHKLFISIIQINYKIGVFTKIIIKIHYIIKMN